MKNIFLLALAFSLLSCKEQEELDKIGKDPETTVLASAISNLETAQDLDILLNEIGDSRYVLLGEASHGTAEYYTWRAEITKRLIQEKGFNLIAVEGDWHDMYRLNQYIKGSSADGANAQQVLQQMNRWPTWMWANQEIADLGEWLRTYNQSQAADQQTGFYGLDVYSLWDSMEEVIAFLDNTDPTAAQAARNALACFAPYNQDEWSYAQSTLAGKDNCADELATMLATVQQKLNEAPEGDEVAFNALQNALVTVNAERYYSTAVRSNAESWNIRDHHMVETINNLMNYHGEKTKIIIWEHNTHIGDARATDMENEGMVNMGQLIREQHTDEGVYIVGFGSYSGTVIAASSWGAQMQEMQVPAAKDSSWEAILHNIAPANKIVLLKELKENSFYMEARGHRAIGVVYNPGAE